MTDYAEQQVAGTEWTRCHQVVIDNRIGAAPLATFHEQRALRREDGSILRVAPRGLVELPYDPAMAIAIRDPATGEETGQSITGADLYAMIYSAYLHAALARDALGAEEPSV
jgi:hypothetical protein